MSRVIFSTSGKGIWSRARKYVSVTDMLLMNVTDCDGEFFGELRVYFDVSSWDVRRDGLIYTDPGFAAELRKFLREHGLPGNAVHYSEQGMQGRNYVSFDAEEAFVDAWSAKFGVVYNKSNI